MTLDKRKNTHPRGFIPPIATMYECLATIMQEMKCNMQNIKRKLPFIYDVYAGNVGHRCDVVGDGRRLAFSKLSLSTWSANAYIEA